MNKLYLCSLDNRLIINDEIYLHTSTDGKTFVKVNFSERCESHHVIPFCMSTFLSENRIHTIYVRECLKIINKVRFYEEILNE